MQITEDNGFEEAATANAVAVASASVAAAGHVTVFFGRHVSEKSMFRHILQQVAVTAVARPPNAEAAADAVAVASASVAENSQWQVRQMAVTERQEVARNALNKNQQCRWKRMNGLRLWQ